MAQRPVFMPDISKKGLVREHQITFDWYPGFSLSQMQKSIKSLHAKAEMTGIKPILEISSKSLNPLGVQLSAFNLRFKMNGYNFSVESAYQGSKVFELGGPFIDIYTLSSRDAKKDERLKTNGELKHFDFFSYIWPLQPTTAFYDWLYIQALSQNPTLSSGLMKYAAFSDIAFNPEKSFSCQARSAALYIALVKVNKLDYALHSPENFFTLIEQGVLSTSSNQELKQRSLFD